MGQAGLNPSRWNLIIISVGELAPWGNCQHAHIITTDIPLGIVMCMIIMCMSPANERWRYNLMSPLVGWAHAKFIPVPHMSVCSWLPQTMINHVIVERLGYVSAIQCYVCRRQIHFCTIASIRLIVQNHRHDKRDRDRSNVKSRPITDYILYFEIIDMITMGRHCIKRRIICRAVSEVVTGFPVCVWYRVLISCCCSPYVVLISCCCSPYVDLQIW